MKRVFLLVLDSFGVGAARDADLYQDSGTSTIKSLYKTGILDIPNLKRLGLFNIDGVKSDLECSKYFDLLGSFGKMEEVSKGKDTTTGHWEIAGVVSKEAFPVYPEGFPESIISEFTKRTGRKVLCNRSFSGTEVIKKYGKEHINSGDLIVYTSADSVFQIAAHERVVDPNKLYEYCKIARQILTGENRVCRVIARPFLGEYPNYTRTCRRRDFSVLPPTPTMLDILKNSDFSVIAVGKISDIFAGRGISKNVKTCCNDEGMDYVERFIDEDFCGLCFVNLVDFDMLYGHRNDAKGYALALNFFDERLGKILGKLKEDDVLIVTADHGCDPGDVSTDHTRENVPLLVYGSNIKRGVNLGTLKTFSDVSATVLDYFGLKNSLCGTSFLQEVKLC